MNAERPGKFERLISTFDSFYEALSGITDAEIARLRRTWSAYKREYPQALNQGVRKQQLAAGLEQRLRELPMLLHSMKPTVREKASAAYELALAANAPEFIERDKLRLQRIIDRKSIRNAGEFHLVRHRIDALQANAKAPDELSHLYELLNAFEVRLRSKLNTRYRGSIGMTNIFQEFWVEVPLIGGNGEVLRYDPAR